MGAMFSGCSSLTSLDLSDWNPANAIDMHNMFNGCENLTTLNISSWNTTTVNDMQYMFSGCTNLTSLDISGWNTANVWYMTGMFANCSALTTIYVGASWSTELVYGEWGEGIFTNCTALVGGMGTAYDDNYTDKTYAHIDGGPSNPGYFTEGPAVKPGDVDGDGHVKISDVTALIDLLLGGDTSNNKAADVNKDGKVDISDVTTLIDLLLRGD